MIDAKTEDQYIHLRSAIARIVRELSHCPAEQASEAVAEQILDGLMLEFGGTRVYIPSAVASHRRYPAIRQAFRGNNMREVCREFGVSRYTVYRAITKK